MARKTNVSLAFALSAALAFGTIPAPALAEMAEEAMGEESIATQVTGRNEAKEKGAAAVDAGLAPMAEEGAADVPADAELAVEGLAVQDAVAPDELEAAGVPAEEAGEDEPGLSTQSVGQLYNPRVFTRPRANLDQVVTWDCVWLGSYPQTEVPETTALWNASWKDGDATVDGVRYRRISKEDTINSANWGNVSGYCYFRYEPIKWRILKVSGNNALAVADVALDCRPYHKESASVTWETSTIRRWLNGMGGPYYSQGAQSGRTAWGFTSVAFTPEQLGAVRQSTIANADNTDYGTAGGNDSTDRVFLLSEAEVHGASATVHGFAADPKTYDEARHCKLTDYAMAMGGSSWCWWLRSPGSTRTHAAGVGYGGYVYPNGHDVGNDEDAVRPALNLNLSSPHLTWAGTVSSDGTVDPNAKPGSVKPFPDVPANSWCSGVVYRATTLRLMSGYDNGNFGPNDPITRGQVAVVLWNMAGKPAPGAGAKYFPDVMSNDYFWRAVSWASGAGVVSGYSNGNFGPKDNVTREQLAVMLANYARYKTGRQLSGSASDYGSMSDADSVSTWAQSSVGWCCRFGILSGSNGQLRPQGNASRAEAAKMVVGLHDLLG